MLIPFGTDAPIYHRPVGTIGLIVVNALVLILFGAGPRGWAEPLWLSLGDGLHPLQWLTSVFVHGDIFHLLGNMLFLWVFGLVVEGKLGWKAFLACYLVAGVGESLVFQWTHLQKTDPPFYAGGASAAIFGLMAMAAIWAPANSVEYKWLVPYGIGDWFTDWRHIAAEALDRDGDMTTFSVRIDVLAVLYISLNVMEAVAGSGSGLAHLGGAVLGLPMGIALLFFGVVDCEGWDAFSLLLQRRRGHFDAVLEDRERTQEVADARRRRAESGSESRQECRRLIETGDFLAAQTLRRSLADYDGGFPLEQDELRRLALGLRDAKAWREAAEVMEEYLRMCPLGTEETRIELARIRAAWLDDPAGALAALEPLDAEMLSPEQQALVEKIGAKSRANLARRPPAG